VTRLHDDDDDVCEMGSMDSWLRVLFRCLPSFLSIHWLDRPPIQRHEVDSFLSRRWKESVIPEVMLSLLKQEAATANQEWQREMMKREMREKDAYGQIGKLVTEQRPAFICTITAVVTIHQRH